ncbi:MAG TPA: single-stranded DNA-binding protein [Acidobacteriaceae bacterium]|jgi:single-strand DNA-binding protein
MSKSVNKVILLGNVGKAPEVTAFQSGDLKASFSLATTDRVKDQDGNWNDRTEGHNLVAYRRYAEVIRDYVHKGSKIYIEGKIVTRSWDDKETGKKVYRTEIIVLDLSLLDNRSKQSMRGDGNVGQHREQGRTTESRVYSHPGGSRQDNYGDLGIDHSEIPF